LAKVGHAALGLPPGDVLEDVALDEAKLVGEDVVDGLDGELVMRASDLGAAHSTSQSATGQQSRASSKESQKSPHPVHSYDPSSQRSTQAIISSSPPRRRS